MVYQLLGALAAAIFAFLAGRQSANADAARAFNTLRDKYHEYEREIAAMDSDDVDDELAERLRRR